MPPINHWVKTSISVMRIFLPLGSGLITVWLAATLVFFALRMLPGDAVELQLARIGATEAEKQTRREQLGFNEPLINQYLSFIAHLVRFDFGNSIYTGLPVNEMIVQRLSNTLQLAAVALLLCILIGLLLGFMEGVGIAGIIPTFMIQLALSVPLYWTGILLLFISSIYWRLPITEHTVVLPALVLGFHTSGPIARLISTEIKQSQQSDYVRTARSKGLRPSRIIIHHMLRPALLPTITLISLHTGFLIGGTVFIESIFKRPGVGLLLLEAVFNQDYPVVQGIVILSATTYTAFNIISDWLLQFIDPRIRIV